MRCASALLFGGLWLACAAPALAGTPGAAPVSAPAARPLDFERVFASPSLAGAPPRGVQLSPDGRWLTLLRARPEDLHMQDLWGYDRHTGQWRKLVDASGLSAGGALSEAEKMRRERLRIGDMKGVVGYQWSADSRRLLVPLDGAVFVVGLDGAARRLDLGEGVLAPALSPAGGHVAFLRGGALWAAPLAGGPARAVTPAEGGTVHWGEAEFVAQEEMGRQEGYWWAPDDSRIAVERFDEAPVGVVTRAAIGAAGATTYAQRYPAAGTPNAAVSLWVMRPDGSGRVEVALGADAYLARVDWAADGKTLYVQRETRAQDRLDMLAVDPQTGAARVLFSESAPEKSWINLSSAYRFLKDGSLIWWSERSGFGHLYHYAGGQWRALTQGPWVVTDLVGVDEAHGRLFFTATRDDPLATQVYALDYRQPGAAPQRLTDPAFVNSAIMDKAGQTLAITRSSPAQPAQVYLADAGGHQLAWIAQNALDAHHPYAPYLAAHRQPVFGTIAAEDGTPLHWKMITPPMEPGKRYPVFFEHYGGPHVQMVTKAWPGALEQAIVARGYIYFAIDNRGSANRGRAFESAIWHGMGGPEVADQLAGARYLKGLAFVDPGKIAIYGWSYGGYMTLKMLEGAPGTYAAGIAGAPVTRWELYDTHYTERYMGTPQGSPQAYARAGVAGAISDPLLLVHGLADDNVVFDHSSQLIAAMQAANRPFEMMLYPGQTHHVAGPGISPHLWNTIFAFLARHGVTPP